MKRTSYENKQLYTIWRRANYDFHLRLTKQQKQRLVVLAEASGFATLSEYFRFMLFNPSIDEKPNRVLEIVKVLQEKAKTPDTNEN